MRKTRSLAALAAAALGGGALALIAPTAAQAAVPATADVSGAVTVGGAPVANAFVELYGLDADGTYSDLGYAYTDASGQYWFDFNATDPNAEASDGVASAGNDRQGFLADDAPTQTVFKLYFGDSRDETRGQLDWQGEFTGDQPTLKRATPIARNTAGMTAVPTADLAVDSGAQGTVAVPVPAGYQYEGTVYAYNSDDEIVSTADFDGIPANDATDPLDGLASWEMRDLYPGGDYTFRFFADATPIDPNSTADDITYIGQYYGGSTTSDGAKVVTTKAGAFSTGINGSLTNVLQATVKPSIKGQVAPGSKVKADHGTWNLTAETRYSYQWLLNGKLVSTADTYKLPKKAKKTLGKKLQLVVTNQVGDYSGTVALKAVKVKNGAAFKGKPKAGYVKGKRVVVVAGTIKLKNVKKKAQAKVLKGIKVTVYEVSKTDDTLMKKKGRATVKNGKVYLTVKGLISGKHYLEVDITGKKIAEIVRTYRVKV